MANRVMSEAAKAAMQAIADNEKYNGPKRQSDILREQNEKAFELEHESYIRSSEYKKEKALFERSAFKDQLQSYLLEGFLEKIFNTALGSKASIISEDTKKLNKSLIKGFINEEGGADAIISMMETKSNMLAEAALYINEEVEDQMDKYDKSEDKKACIDTDEGEEDPKDSMLDKIDGSEEFEDVSQEIQQRVSMATQNFIQKNMQDKMTIQDTMSDTKEKIEAIRTGDEETDEEIKQEQTIKMKRAIRNITNRPHSIYEQLVMNLTEAIMKDEKAKPKFTLESGKLDMDAIVERATSFYTLLEMVNTLNLKKMDKEYIQNMISMK